MLWPCLKPVKGKHEVSQVPVPLLLSEGAWLEPWLPSMLYTQRSFPGKPGSRDEARPPGMGLGVLLWLTAGSVGLDSLPGAVV